MPKDKRLGLNQFSKHIALTLLVIFVFPIYFQSIHIVWHHGHGSDHSTCCAHASECSQEHFIIDGIQYQTTEDHCLICEYDPIAFKVLNNSIITFQVQEFQWHYIEMKTTLISTPLILQNASRAPPPV